MTASRIQPDSRPVLIVATVITALLAAVSFLLSFNGLAEAASWANVPGWLAWALPAYVDGAILVYTVAALVFRSRGESARLEWAALGLFAALSVAANGVHAWTTAPAWLQVALGVTLAALAPVSVLLTTHTLAKLVVAPPTAANDWTETELSVAEVYAQEEIIPGALELPEEPIQAWSGATIREAAPEPDAAAEAAPMTSPTPILSTSDRNARIHELAAQKKSLRAIAAEVGCSKSNVARVLGKRPDADAEDAEDAEDAA
ncbi:hypothetical protein PBI_FLOOF_58 [Microbacterium phage Floof]|uniref:Helix-turn-helix DNA binding domain protein n=1 Tax=Microbacterium phage Floof TaxID=2201433 RepID=A0A2Z4Q4L1_9CAUD|nr:hypothetical protein PBI_FLOOF_58 [Microbacterium phage Floof]